MCNCEENVFLYNCIKVCIVFIGQDLEAWLLAWRLCSKHRICTYETKVSGDKNMIILRIMMLFIPSLCLKENDESNNIFLGIKIQTSVKWFFFDSLVKVNSWKLMTIIHLNSSYRTLILSYFYTQLLNLQLLDEKMAVSVTTVSQPESRFYYYSTVISVST